MATSQQDGPDPTGAQTPAAFMELLRQTRAASGLSLVEIAERARQRGYDLDPVGLNRALDQPALPSWQTVTGVLAACGMPGMQIDRWMRVYHDLAAPAQTVLLETLVTAVRKPIDVEPVSVPPLVLTTAAAKPARLGPRHFAIAAGVLVVLLIVPLLWLFARSEGGPENIAAQATSSPPRTVAPAPSPSEELLVQPLPTGVATPTTPAAPAIKPPTRTSAPPSPPSPPSPQPPSPTAPVVLRSGSLSLTGNQGFDLDTGRTDGERDIYRYDGDTLARMNDSVLKPASGMPSKQACQPDQGWRNWVSDLQAGHWLCVRTSDGRFGRLNITGVGSTLKVSYTVWA